MVPDTENLIFVAIIVCELANKNILLFTFPISVSLSLSDCGVTEPSDEPSSLPSSSSSLSRDGLALTSDSETKSFR